eukprot:2320005-Rhodomonas_salina.1
MAKVPEHVLKKRKAQDAIAAKKAEELAVQRKANKTARAEIYKKAKGYAKEYKDTEAQLVNMRRVAKKHNNFFMEPEPKVVFVVRIKGINAVDPKTRKILQLMRLRQRMSRALNRLTLPSLFRAKGLDGNGLSGMGCVLTRMGGWGLCCAVLRTGDQRARLSASCFCIWECEGTERSIVLTGWCAVVQINNGVFMKVNSASIMLLRLVA